VVVKAQPGLHVPGPGCSKALAPLRSQVEGSVYSRRGQSNDYFTYASPFDSSAHALSSSVLYPRFRDAAFLSKKTSGFVGWPMVFEQHKWDELIL
jgi:hypothetical protein